jgi:hypothetical protein
MGIARRQRDTGWKLMRAIIYAEYERPMRGFYLRSGKVMTFEKLPLKIKLIRIGKRLLDKDDNLPAAFKAFKDGICDALKINDGNKAHAVWEYAQEKGSYGVRVEIT